MSTSKTLRRFFLCTGESLSADQLPGHLGSHIIGELRYVLEEGEQVTALAVYEQSMPSNIIPSPDPRIRVEIIGDARGIKCTCCHRQYQRWQIGKVAVRQLLQRSQRPML